MQEKAPGARWWGPERALGRVGSLGGQPDQRTGRAVYIGQHLPHGHRARRHVSRVRGHRRHGREPVDLGQAAKEPARGWGESAGAEWVGVRPGGGHHPVHVGGHHGADAQRQPPGSEAGPGIVIEGQQGGAISRNVLSAVHAQRGVRPVETHPRVLAEGAAAPHAERREQHPPGCLPGDRVVGVRVFRTLDRCGSYRDLFCFFGGRDAAPAFLTFLRWGRSFSGGAGRLAGRSFSGDAARLSGSSSSSSRKQAHHDMRA